jgi:hypothetical protein
MGCDDNIETSLAPLKTTRPMEVRHGQTVPGVLKELTVLAIVDHLGRMVLGPAAMRPHIGVARLSVLDARRWLGGPSTGSP